MPKSLSATDIFQARLTFQITDPPMDLAAARQAAAKIDGMLAPDILSHLAEPPPLAGSLLQNQSIFRCLPTTLFTQNRKLGVAHIPAGWIEPYLAWAALLKNSKHIADGIARMNGPSTDLNWEAFRNPVVAGLMLFSFSPEPGSAMRQALFATALQNPLGGYLCAESLHTTPERADIIKSISPDSLALLGASRVHGFADACLRQAMTRHDLASGLVVARVGSDTELTVWLRTAGLAACEEGDAAAAMLVLAPTAPKGLLGLWLTTLQSSTNASYAYAAVRWTRYTWPVTEWADLKSVLRNTVTADRSVCWFNWFNSIEPENAANALTQDANALWAFELLHAQNLDPDPLRFRLSDQLGRLTYDREASLVLAAIDHRERLKRKGELNETAL